MGGLARRGYLVVDGYHDKVNQHGKGGLHVSTCYLAGSDQHVGCMGAHVTDDSPGLRPPQHIDTTHHVAADLHVNTNQQMNATQLANAYQRVDSNQHKNTRHVNGHQAQGINPVVGFRTL